MRHFPRKLSRGTRPARPAGGGTNAFCFPSMGAPAPSRLPELSVTRLRAGATQSFTTLQPSRVARNKIQSLFASQTFRFNFPISAFWAFPRPSPFREMSALSRPDLPTQSGRAEGIPVGRQSLPQGEPFPATFPFARKSSPCGAKKQTIFAYKKSETKLQRSCGANNKK